MNLALINQILKWTQLVIVIVNLYSASSGEAPQRHSRPNKTKPWSKRMVFRRLRKRGRDRARSSERRRLGKAFQKDGPTTAKLLRWAVASLTLGTTRSPCSAERRDLRPGKDDTGTQSSLR